jgi:hypothetical protein
MNLNINRLIVHCKSSTYMILHLNGGYVRHTFQHGFECFWCSRWAVFGVELVFKPMKDGEAHKPYRIEKLRKF